MFIVTKLRAGLVLSRSRVNERSSDHTQVPPINLVVVVCVIRCDARLQWRILQRYSVCVYVMRELCLLRRSNE